MEIFGLSGVLVQLDYVPQRWIFGILNYFNYLFSPPSMLINIGYFSWLWGMEMSKDHPHENKKSYLL